MLLFYEGYIVLVSHPNTNPAEPLGINFSELLYYKAVRCSEGTLKLVVKKSLSTCQPRSQCFSLPIYFLQSFWVQYFASNHMSSQTIYPRRVRTCEPKGLFWYDFLMTPQLEKNCLERCTYHRQPSVPSRRV